LTIDKTWKILDLGRLNIASLQYQKAKKAYKIARIKPILDNYKDAEKKYQKFTELCTIDTVAYTEYAEILQFLKKPDEAIEMLEKAYEQKSKRPKFLITDQSFLELKLFEAYTENDKYDKAIGIFKKINSEKHEQIGSLIDRIANSGEVYNKQIKEILKEKDSKYKIETRKVLPFNKRNLSYALKENHDTHKTKLLIFLNKFESASYASIRSNITKNKSTTDKILKELISEGIIEHEHIFSNDIFRITKEGEKSLEEIYEVLKQNKENVGDNVDTAYYFEPKDMSKFKKELEKLEEIEKKNKKDIEMKLGLESESNQKSDI
jgi:tetratricopeptide (TPR) repeat protein